jgi:hypothetical protein
MWLFYQITSLEAYGSQTQSTGRKNGSTSEMSLSGIVLMEYGYSVGK